jgi:hypothetical protein
MELLAATAVALFGYYSSVNKGRRGDGRKKSYAPLNDATEQNDALPTDLIKGYTKDSEDRWNEARVPKVSGIITPDTRPAEIMPFFTSAKTQNTNSAVKQRKMELFTGNLLEETSKTGTWKHKVEADSMFKPAAQGVVTSGGTVGNPQGDADLDKARMIQSKLQNNVLPTEQLRVGPGMAVGPDVAATGGFHQFYRQLPLNVNEYKLTQLPGRPNHGASAVQRPESAQMVTVNHNPGSLNWTLEDRPMMATQAAALAHSTTQTADVVRPFAGLKPMEKNYAGIKGVSALEAPQIASYDDMTRGRTKLFETDDISNPVINRTGTRAGLGGYTFSTDTTLKPWSQRGQQLSRPTAGPKTAIPAPQMAAHEMRSTARQTQTRELTNPAGRMNVFRSRDGGKVGSKRYPRYDALAHATSKAPVQIPKGTEGMPVRTGSKRVLRNPWLNDGVIAGQRKQNERNPYAHDVSKCGGGTNASADHPLPQLRIAADPWTPRKNKGLQLYPKWASSS